EESIGGDETIATEMDAVIDLLRRDAAALDIFMTKMVSMGWTDEMRSTGELLRFLVRGASIYAVDDTFPRLPDSFTPPSGVVAVKYTIDLANLPALGTEEAMEIIRNSNLCQVLP
ncbi:PD-(D/E)XK motif protein, partial [Ralstonia nicotianae]